jgi:thioredoxin-related protein
MKTNNNENNMKNIMKIMKNINSNDKYLIMNVE